MKTKIILKNNLYMLLLFFALLTFVSCEKKMENNPEIDENNLTACPANSNCDYLFAENADWEVQNFLLKTGNYRLFWNVVNYGGMTTRLHIKTPMQGNKFSLNDQDILNGLVKFYQICPFCDYVGLKPVGGFVKGINTATNKKAKWLLEAKIFMESEGNSSIKDTLYIKQYFSHN